MADIAGKLLFDMELLSELFVAAVGQGFPPAAHLMEQGEASLTGQQGHRQRPFQTQSFISHTTLIPSCQAPPKRNLAEVLLQGQGLQINTANKLLILRTRQGITHSFTILSAQLRGKGKEGFPTLHKHFEPLN